MAIYKADIKADYTVIPNALAQDKRLSFEARGLLILLLSMPANWHVNKSWVEEQSGNCGRDKTNRLFKELQEAGYIRKKTVHDEKGLITGTDWLIYPTSETSAKSNRTTEKPSNGKPATVELENRTTDKPHDGKPATIKETDLQNKHSKKINKKVSGISLESLPEQISKQVAKDFIDHRKALKKPLTQKAFELAMSSAIKCVGVTPDQAIDICIERGWQTPRPEWIANHLNSSRSNHQTDDIDFNSTGWGADLNVR